jgi:hypothetical protein
VRGRVGLAALSRAGELGPVVDLGRVEGLLRLEGANEAVEEVPGRPGLVEVEGFDPVGEGGGQEPRLGAEGRLLDGFGRRVGVGGPLDEEEDGVALAVDDFGVEAAVVEGEPDGHAVGQEDVGVEGEAVRGALGGHVEAVPVPDVDGVAAVLALGLGFVPEGGDEGGEEVGGELVRGAYNAGGPSAAQGRPGVASGGRPGLGPVSGSAGADGGGSRGSAGRRPAGCPR